MILKGNFAVADWVLCGLALVLLACLAVFEPRSKSRRIYPPGPPRHPIWGNLFNFPRVRWHETFTEWQKSWGEFIYVSFLGMPMLIVQDREIADELMNKRGNQYSDRPRSVMCGELMGWVEWSPGMIQPGKQHTESRRLLQKGLSLQAVSTYKDLIDTTNKELLKWALDYSGDPEHITSRVIGRVLVGVAYGDALTREEEAKLLAANREALAITARAFASIHLVDFIPILKHVPSWMPGAGFKRLAEFCRTKADYVRYEPWKSVMRDYNMGISRHSMAARLLEEEGPHDGLRDAIAVLYASGGDTSIATTLSFLYAMLLYPECQKRAQAEIDAVIGPDKHPTTADRSKLPYLEAMWKETLRWHPSVPLALPHMTREEDEYRGYFVPKGVMIHPNIMFMCHDPRVWDEPNTFKPERFLGEIKEPMFDPLALIFGFGRRICPGRFLADSMVYSFMLSLLWTYDVLPHPDDPAGTHDRLYPKFEDATISAPSPFKCVFKPRNKSKTVYVKELVL